MEEIIAMSEIVTQRLIVRKFRETDYDDLLEFLSQLKKSAQGRKICRGTLNGEAL